MADFTVLLDGKQLPVGAGKPLERPRRRSLATIPWAPCMWLVAFGVMWDAAGLWFAGRTSVYSGPGYTVLRHMPGGMRTYGVLLGALILVTVYAYGRSLAARDSLLKRCLSLLSGWYVLWTGALVCGWLTAGSWSGADAVGRTLVFATLCGYVAYYAPRR